ncbi:MAG: GIY-YIG nuclease family protein [Propionicimonas sp.]|uniref:GIY-YIG nuclease family protein n=1 Tax=Propionicimonas sp. TaxID=1955623 RepID=UPI003D0E7F0D
MTNASNTVLYVGVTTDLIRRVAEHKLDASDFTARYHCHRLVYYEATDDLYAALNREKQLKKWHREWKNALVARENPGWHDLSASIGVTQAVLDYVRDARSSPA